MNLEDLIFEIGYFIMTVGLCLVAAGSGIMALACAMNIVRLAIARLS